MRRRQQSAVICFSRMQMSIWMGPFNVRERGSEHTQFPYTWGGVFGLNVCRCYFLFNKRTEIAYLYGWRLITRRFICGKCRNQVSHGPRLKPSAGHSPKTCHARYVMNDSAAQLPAANNATTTRSTGFSQPVHRYNLHINQENLTAASSTSDGLHPARRSRIFKGVRRSRASRSHLSLCMSAVCGAFNCSCRVPFTRTLRKDIHEHDWPHWVAPKCHSPRSRAKTGCE